MTDEVTMKHWAETLGLAESAQPAPGGFLMTLNGTGPAVEFERRDPTAWRVTTRAHYARTDVEHDWGIPAPFAGSPPASTTGPDMLGNAARQIAAGFPLVDARTTSDEERLTVEFFATLFDEELNHQAFALTVSSLLHAVDVLNSVRLLHARQHEALAELGEKLTVERIDSALTSTEPPPISDGSVGHETTMPMSPAVGLNPPAPPPWSPTHEVAIRAQAWENPDPSSPTTGALDAHLLVQVLDRQGDWAHVACSNGWSAWIDARNLTAR